MILVGLTGGIGSGKTTVLGCFRGLGAETSDADEEVHRLYEPGTDVYRAVLARWGTGILRADGSVNRAAVAEIVFRGGTELEWLSELVHPPIRQAILERAAVPMLRLFVCALPLLYETHWDRMTCRNVAVWCDPQTQARRLRRRGWDEEQVRSRASRQMTMDEKLQRADFGIINTGSMELLRQQCRRVYEELCRQYGAGGASGHPDAGSRPEHEQGN
ncbi:MAG: dephospho-CoA kinase [Lentisphaeria bacterium]|nr:dephospho-CoA kinase [Lentisphaeria bacterium]